jgi:hypothetical protein
VTSADEPTSPKRPRKRHLRAASQRSRSTIGGRSPKGTEEVRRETIAQCELEIARWLDGDAKAERRLIELAKGELERKRTEDAARDLWERARRAAPRGTLEALEPEIIQFVERTPDGAGGIGAMALRPLAEALAKGIVPTKLATLAEKEKKYAALMAKSDGRSEGFPAFVRTLFLAAPRPPINRRPTNRVLAAFAILYGQAPENWKRYGETADVIEAVETRVRRIVGPDGK